MPTICPSCGQKNLEGVDECANCGADLRSVDLPKPLSPIERTVMDLPLTALRLSQPHTIAPDATLEQALGALSRHKIDLLAVVENDALVGVLSVRDVVTRVGPDYRGCLGRPVRQFMTSNPEALPPDAPIAFAINKMDVGGYRHVPVVQDGRLVGIASTGDVIRHLIRNSSKQVAIAGRTTSHGVEGAYAPPA